MKINDVICQELPSVQAELRRMLRKFPQNAEVFIKEVPAGSYFIREGDPCRCVYLVLEGNVTPQYDLGHNAFVAKHFKRLSIMGDIAALGNLEHYTTSIRTVTKCRLMGIRVSDYWEWLLADPECLKSQTEIAINTLIHELTEKRAMEGESSEIRLINYFVLYCRRRKSEKNKTIIVRVTREKIAEEIGGVSSRTINRKIAMFEEKGLITLVHGKIQISSEQLQKMEKIIGGQNEEDY